MKSINDQIDHILLRIFCTLIIFSFCFNDAYAQNLLDLTAIRQLSWKQASSSSSFNAGIEAWVTENAPVFFTFAIPENKPITLSMKLNSSSEMDYALRCGDKKINGEISEKSSSSSIVYTEELQEVIHADGCMISFGGVQGGAFVNIESIGFYSSPKHSCSQPKVTIVDDKSITTQGNGDGEISPFEIVEVVISIFDARGDIQLDVKDSAHLSLLSIPTLEVDPKDSQHIDFKLLVTPKIKKELSSEEKLLLPFKLSCNPTPFEITLPYRHALGDDLELTRKHKTIEPFDFKDKDQLDVFLGRYPQSERAPLILAARMKLLRERAAQAVKVGTQQEIIQAINEYHEFIELYPSTVGAEVAVNEVFGLYRRQDSISGYADFMHRYPQSLEASLSYEHLKRKAYEATIQQSDLSAYDAFLESFPDAEPYVSDVIKRAQNLALRQEEEHLKELERSLSGKKEEFVELLFKMKRDERAGAIFHQWDQLSQVKTTTKNALLLRERMKRLDLILNTKYQASGASRELSLSKRLVDIQRHLQEIDERIQRQHQEGLQAIESNFKALRTHLNARFSEMGEHLTRVEERLKRQEESVQLIDQRFKELNSLVETHYQSLKAQSGQLQSSLDHLKALGLADTALTALSSGLELYNALQQPYQSSNSYHLSIPVELKTNLNQKSKPASQARSWMKMACPAAAAGVTSLLSATGPVAVGVGMASRFACQWGVDKAMNWFEG